MDWPLYEFIFIVVSGVVYVFGYIIANRLLRAKPRDLLSVLPHRSLYFTSGSQPSIENDRSRCKKIDEFLKTSLTDLPSVPANERIEKYVCVDPGLRNRILRIGLDIESYLANPNKQRPLSVFLHAPPGSGKSFLVENLIDHINANELASSKYQLRFSKDHEHNLTAYENYKTLAMSLRKVLDGDNHSVPVIFIDELDSAKWQPFKCFLPVMWDGRLTPQDVKYELGKCVLIFATSLEVVTGDQFDELIRRYLKRAYGVIRRLWARVRSQSAEELLSGIRKFSSESDWIRWRELQLRAFRAQDSIEKIADFLDRVDYFLHLPSSREYFKYSDNGELYFADKENLYIAVAFIKKYYGSVSEVEKGALLAVTSNLFSSRRDMERCIYLSRCPINSNRFEFAHLDSDLQDDYKRRYGDNLMTQWIKV